MTNPGRKPLSRYRRVVIKIGSSLLVDRDRGLKSDWLAALCSDIAILKQQGVEVLVVSSGAVAMGRTLLGFARKALKLEENQACAAIGQIALARAWSEGLSAHDLITGQVLLTFGDTQERRRYLNARATIGQLIGIGAVPIINENDTVATAEIRYGDNDRLAARVATMISADLLVLLSDVDGLYSAPPALVGDARFLDHIAAITPEIEAMAGEAASDFARGGMRTKLEAGKIATKAGCAMIIASGKELHPLRAIDSNARSSWFAPSGTPVAARKTWIAGQLDPSGRILVDSGAIKALRSGKSLLPAGVRAIEGRFERGDAVIIAGPDRAEIARGLASYDADDARRIAGLKSSHIEQALGYPGRAAMVHRDDLVLTALTPDLMKDDESAGSEAKTHHAG